MVNGVNTKISNGGVMKEKECKKCKEMLSLDEFYRDRSTKDGRASSCRHCKKVYKQAWRYAPNGYKQVRAYKARDEKPEPFDPDLELKRRAENWVAIYGKQAAYEKARIL